MKKQVRVNKTYGEWFYRKEVDFEDSSNYMYYFYGTDANGKEWAWSTPFYNEILEFIKADDDNKQKMINCY